jgi:hypothetical protein
MRNCITCLPQTQARRFGGKSVTTLHPGMHYEEFLIIRKSTNVLEILIGDLPASAQEQPEL